MSLDIVNKNRKEYCVSACEHACYFPTLESAHLIWKLRCERVIKFEGKQEKFHSETEVYNRWVHTMNTRLKFNHLLTDSLRYSSKALKMDTVLKTRSGVLTNEEYLPDNWVHISGVLVGMAPCPPPGWNR
jgi:ribonuclease HI